MSKEKVLNDYSNDSEIKDDLTSSKSIINSNDNFTDDISFDQSFDDITGSKMSVEARSLTCEIKSRLAATFVLDPISQYMILSAAAARTSNTTTAITNGSFKGQLLILEGTDDTNTITIKDNANTKLAGDCALGAQDTLMLIWNGSDWVEVSRSNN